jgi:hypothetical protein
MPVPQCSGALNTAPRPGEVASESLKFIATRPKPRTMGATVAVTATVTDKATLPLPKHRQMPQLPRTYQDIMMTRTLPPSR